MASFLAANNKVATSQGTIGEWQFHVEAKESFIYSRWGCSILLSFHFSCPRLLGRDSCEFSDVTKLNEHG